MRGAGYWSRFKRACRPRALWTGKPLKGTARAHLSRMSLSVVCALLGTAMTVSVGSALGSETTEPQGYFGSDSIGPFPVDLSAASPVDYRPTNPSAAEEMPQRGLSRSEALSITQAVFEPLLESATDPTAEFDIERYVTDTAAVVSPMEDPSPLALIGGGNQSSPADQEADDNDRLLLETSFPLRVDTETGDDVPVDLSLERSEDSIEPRVPLVELELPQELGDGIRLPDLGIDVNLLGMSSGVAPSLLDNDIAAYPNVGTDTDFLALPTPTGLETMTTLRSREASHEQRLEFDLPEGAELLPSGRGAEVVEGQRTILRILRPFAIDADGKEVPVALNVSGSVATLRTDAPESAAYPILVDPIFETYDWLGTNTTTGQGSWRTQIFGGTRMSVGAGLTGFPALDVAAQSGWHAAGEQAAWFYAVPRLAEEEALGRQPNSYIARMRVWHLGLQNWGSGPAAPFLFAGIWGGAGTWAGTPGNQALWTLPGNSPEAWMNPGYEVQFENGEPGKRDQGAKVAVGIGITTNVNAELPTPRRGQLGAASVEIADENKPGVANANTLPWQDQNPVGKVTATAEDAGLGVKALRFSDPSASETVVNAGCPGTAAYPCPRTWTGSLASSNPMVNPANLPQGYNYVSVASEDVVGNRSPSVVKALIPVDHNNPLLSVAGSVTEQSKLGTMQPSYSLTYSAKDGSTAVPSALGATGGFGAAPGQMKGPRGVAADGKGNVWVVDRGNDRVQQFDESGTLIRQIGSTGTGPGQFREPYGVAVTAEGKIWVTDTGNQRVQQFGSNGQYLQQFGYKWQSAGRPTGTGFVEPLGIAWAPNGTLWVADFTGQRVAQFQEGPGSPTYIREFTGITFPQSPIGVAASATRVWVVETICGCVKTLSSTGSLLGQFGAPGSGAGQLSVPTSIAIAPSGHLLVSDQENNRIQQFHPNGVYVRQFGTGGSGLANFSGQQGLALGRDNRLFVADTRNHRLVRWANAVYDAQSGVMDVKVKVDGSVVTSKGQTCSAGSCDLSGQWKLKTVDYTDGPHTVEVVATDGVGRTSEVATPVTLRPDRTPPTVNLSGSLTEQETVGAMRPRYVLRIDASDPGARPLTHSGSVGTEGGGEGQFRHPGDIARDGSGNLWIADTNNHRIVKMSSDGVQLAAYGSAGSANGKFSFPSAVAIDVAGNIWIADRGNKRVQVLSKTGAFIRKFGSGGTGNGQFAGSGPEGIAIDKDGSVWVSDTGGGRLQKFDKDGTFVSSVGTTGTGVGQIKEPVGLDSDDQGHIWVADAFNNKVLMYGPTGAFLDEFGGSGTGDGNLTSPSGLDVDAGSYLWIADAGNGRVQKWSQSGEYLGQYGTKGAGPGQFSTERPTGLELGPDGVLWVADGGNDRLQKWAIADGSSSGVASVKIEVDGKVKFEAAPGCVEGGCALTQDWLFDASEYSPGSHMVTVRVIDAAGLTSTSAKAVNVTRDVVPPDLTAGGALFGTPEGWVEQEGYGYTAHAVDAVGYGVQTLTFKIDGKVIATESQPCPDGGCAAQLAGSVDMGQFDGGEHEAELVATDGAGNKAVKRWTLNVNPEGAVSASEAVDTLEAADETAASFVVAATDEVFGPEEIEPGTNPGLEISGDDVVSTGTADLTEMTTSPADGFTIHAPDDEFTVTPNVSPAASDLTVAGGVAGVASDIYGQVDSIVRPEYNGLQTFQSIRSLESTETFSWTVKLWPGQQLIAASNQHAEVLYPDGTTAMLISAEAAHDAVGKAVPTSIQVHENILTLTVAHRMQGVVYPVVAGQAFEVAASRVTVVAPPLPVNEEEGEEQEAPYEAEPPPNSDPRNHPRWTLRLSENVRWYQPAPTYGRVQGKIVQPWNVENRSGAGRDKWYVVLSGNYLKTQLIKLTWTIRWYGSPQCGGEIGTGLGGIRYLPGGQVDGSGWFGNEFVESGSGEHLSAVCHYRLKTWPIAPADFDGEMICTALVGWIFPNGAMKKFSRKWDYYGNGTYFCPVVSYGIVF
jgi:sugar lactone lactonase YvrE